MCITPFRSVVLRLLNRLVVVDSMIVHILFRPLFIKLAVPSGQEILYQASTTSHDTATTWAWPLELRVNFDEPLIINFEALKPACDASLTESMATGCYNSFDIRTADVTPQVLYLLLLLAKRNLKLLIMGRESLNFCVRSVQLLFHSRQGHHTRPLCRMEVCQRGEERSLESMRRRNRRGILGINGASKASQDTIVFGGLVPRRFGINRKQPWWHVEDEFVLVLL